MAAAQRAKSTTSDWSEPETWAWTQILAGQVADFSAKCGDLEPEVRKGWRAERTLSGKFLRSILLDKTYVDQHPVEGVRIAGARFSEPLTLSHGTGRSLWLENCRFERALQLNALELAGRLSLRGSFFQGTEEDPALELVGARARFADLSDTIARGGIDAAEAEFTGPLDLSRALIEGQLNLGHSKLGCLLLSRTSCRDVALSPCEVEQDIDLRHATVEGSLNMGAVNIHGDLLINGDRETPVTIRKELFLVGAQVDGNVELIGLTLGGPLNMNAVVVGGHVFLRAPDEGQSRFGDLVDLDHAKVGGHVQISGAIFHATVTMVDINIKEDLGAWDRTVFHGDVILTAATIEGSVDLSDAVFHKGATFHDITVKGRLALDGAESYEPVDLSAAKIEGNLSLNRIIIHSELTLADTHVGRNLFMTDFRGGLPQLKGVTLTNADITGHLNCRAICEGLFNAYGLHVGRNFLTNAEEGNESVFKDGIDLSYARIDGLAEFYDARIEKNLSMANITVGRDLWVQSQLNCPFRIENGSIGGSLTLHAPVANEEIDMRALHVGQDLNLNGRFQDVVRLSRARVERTLDLTAAELSALDFGESFATQLRLGFPSGTARWSHGAGLDLRDASVISLQDSATKTDTGWDSSWPDAGMLQLDGFTYQRLGGAHVKTSEQMIERPAAWFEHWLALDEPYSPQPYEYLAGILRQAGEAEKANRILFASRERARRSARKSGAIGRWIGLTLLMLTIGYGIGYRFFYALGWAALLTLLGVIFLGPDPLRSSGEFILQTWQQKIAYSFDQLLPIIDLNKSFADVELPRHVEYYFYVHKLVGFLLGSFIAAGIAGLTQRSKS